MPFELSTRRITVTDNYELDQIARYLGDPIDQILSLPILNGRLIENVELVGGTSKLIEHKLERPFRGYIVVNRNFPVVVFTAQPPAGNIDPPESFLRLESPINVNISLWVF